MLTFAHHEVQSRYMENRRDFMKICGIKNKQSLLYLKSFASCYLSLERWCVLGYEKSLKVNGIFIK